MPAPIITKPNEHFNASLYTGNGGTQSITGVGFQPDFVWGKSRSNATSNFLYDAVRGVYKRLISDSTAAETDETGGGLSSFNSDGFTVQANSTENGNARTFVAWNWKAGGAAVTNTSGTISSQVSANPIAGFSVVTYTGNGTAGATIGHGLGVAPSMMIAKNRSSGGSASYEWTVYHTSLGATKAVFLNDTGAAATDAGYWYNTAPTSTLITVPSNTRTNVNGSNFVIYCFAQVAGYSAFGSYTGNGSADGPFVFTNFRSRFIMFKNTTTGSTNWQINDSARDTFNVANKRLSPSTSDAEATNFNFGDFLSNGFKIRQTDQTWNKNGDTYIYAAFAENPFKFANAR